MKNLLNLWPEISAACLGFFTFHLSRIWILSIILSFLWLILIRGHIHVTDNSELPLFIMGNYFGCVGPGHHFVAWPFVLWGDPIDTRYTLTECEVANATSADQMPFKIILQFSHRFLPDHINDRQRAQEIISGGPLGRTVIAQETAKNAALYITRGYSHMQLMTGTQQALIQGQIAQETAQRLDSAGMEIQTTSFRTTFEGPKELEAAFISKHVASPAAESVLIRIKKLVPEIRNHGPQDLGQYIDLIMAEYIGRQDVDPLYAMLAKDWFNSSRKAVGGKP
jgi:hypothetical protein